MFIDGGDCYYEFEINALGTIYDADHVAVEVFDAQFGGGDPHHPVAVVLQHRAHEGPEPVVDVGELRAVKAIFARAADAARRAGK